MLSRILLLLLLLPARLCDICKDSEIAKLRPYTDNFFLAAQAPLSYEIEFCDINYYDSSGEKCKAEVAAYFDVEYDITPLNKYPCHIALSRVTKIVDDVISFVHNKQWASETVRRYMRCMYQWNWASNVYNSDL